MTDNPPGVIPRTQFGFTFKAGALVAATTHVDLATFSRSDAIDGIVVELGNRVLLTAQGSPSDNGLYEMREGAELANGQSFNGSGQLTISGLVEKQWYQWVKGNATQAQGSTILNESGMIECPSSLTLVLTGPPSTAFTGSIKEIKLRRDAGMDESAEFVPGMLVSVSKGTANAGSVWEYTGSANPTLGLTSLPFTRKGGSTVSPPLSGITFTNTPPGALDPCELVPA